MTDGVETWGGSPNLVGGTLISNEARDEGITKDFVNFRRALASGLTIIGAVTACGGRSERTLQNNEEDGTGGNPTNQPGAGGTVDSPGVGGTSTGDGGAGISTGGDTRGTGGASTGGRGPGDGGTGGVSAPGGGTGGEPTSGGTGGESDGSGGSATVVMDGPCDIYEEAETPCAVAYSPIRRLKRDYAGPLYQVRVGSSRFNIGGERVLNPEEGPEEKMPYQTEPEVGTLLDIPQTADGFVDASVLEAACSTVEGDGLPLCTVSLLYDQSGHRTDLPVARGGVANGGAYAAYDDFETVMDGSARLTVGGRTAYSLSTDARNGYRIEEVGVGMPVDDEPQEIYMLADGTHAGALCCFSFGNVPTNPASFGSPTSLFFGEAFWGTGADAPPWFGAELDSGVWMGGSEEGDPGWGSINSTDHPPNEDNPSMAGVPFALGILKTNDDANMTYALRMADVSAATELTTAYEGPDPQLSPWSKTDNSGAVVLGVGLSNENNSFGTFYEGAIVAGFPDNATELAVMKNIQAVGYGQ